MTTLRRERIQKFDSIIRQSEFFEECSFHWKEEYIEAQLKELAEALADASISRSEKQTQDVMQSADKKVDGILAADAQAKKAEAEGKAWRGRELLMDAYLPYGDWWHKITGLHMYASKGKPKADATWIKEFQAWWENDLPTDTLMEAYNLEIAWKKVITHPRELTAKALALAAAPKVNLPTNKVFTPQAEPEYVPAPVRKP